MIEFLWNLHQQSRISGLEQDAAGGQRSAAALKRDLQDLQRQVDALTLTCLARTMHQGSRGNGVQRS